MQGKCDGPVDADSATRAEAERRAKTMEEVDLWWGSYAGRTMVPVFVICGLMTLTIIGVTWYFRVWYGLNLVRYVTLFFVAPVWLVLLGRWIYRLIATNYRLTTRHLFCDRGFYRTSNRVVALGEIARVLVERRRRERLLGVGRILVFLQDQGLEPLVLEGVRDPEHIALRIRHQVQKVREE